MFLEKGTIFAFSRVFPFSGFGTPVGNIAL